MKINRETGVQTIYAVVWEADPGKIMDIDKGRLYLAFYTERFWADFHCSAEEKLGTFASATGCYTVEEVSVYNMYTPSKELREKLLVVGPGVPCPVCGAEGSAMCKSVKTGRNCKRHRARKLLQERLEEMGREES